MAAPDPAPRGPDSPRWLVPLTAVVVAVLVAPIVVAALHWLTSGHDSSDSTARAKDPHTGSSASASVSPKPSATASSRPSRKPSRSPSPSPPPSSASSAPPSSSSTSHAAYTCWDGTPVSKLDVCSEPTGLAGLQWVYPSMGHQQCVQQHLHTGRGRTFVYACLASLTDGSKVLVKYSQWTSARAAFEHYNRPAFTPNELVDANGQPTVFGWLGPAKGQSVGINAYADSPFSVEVYVDDAADVIPALTTVVEQRPYDQVRGAPSS